MPSSAAAKLEPMNAQASKTERKRFIADGSSVRNYEEQHTETAGDCRRTFYYTLGFRALAKAPARLLGPGIPVQSRFALLVTAEKLRWSNWNVGCLSGIKKGCTPRRSLARSRNAKSSKREINVEYDHNACSQGARGGCRHLFQDLLHRWGSGSSGLSRH